MTYDGHAMRAAERRAQERRAEKKNFVKQMVLLFLTSAVVGFGAVIFVLGSMDESTYQTLLHRHGGHK